MTVTVRRHDSGLLKRPAVVETIATLPGDWGLAHAIRLEIEPFAQMRANSSSLSGSKVDPFCSPRAILRLAR